MGFMWSRAVARSTPRTIDALADVPVDGDTGKQHGGARHAAVDEEQHSVWKAAALASMGVLILAVACMETSRPVTMVAPSLSVWLELGGAVAISVALNVLLAA